MLTNAKYSDGKVLEAIRLGEEVMFTLDRNQSRLSEFNTFRINLAHNLSQYLLSENRYDEALSPYMRLIGKNLMAKVNGLAAFASIAVQFLLMGLAGFFAVRGYITIGSIMAVTQLQVR